MKQLQNPKKGAHTSTSQKHEKALFNPDAIADRIHQALNLDLQTPIMGTNVGTNCCISDLAKSFYVDAQTNGFKKKYKTQNKDIQDKLEMESKLDFLINLRRLRGVESTCNYLLSAPEGARIHPDTDPFVALLIRARSAARWILDPAEFTLERWFEECKNSSGTTLGTKYESTNLEDKFVFPITSTQEAAALFPIYLAWDPQLREALEAFNAKNPLRISPLQIVKASRLTTVDKDDRARRVIAIEPTWNMFLQQGLMQLLFRALQPFVDMKSAQFKHQLLAMIASVTKENSTIDFSKASDSVLLKLVKFLVPPIIYKQFMVCRTPSVLIDGTEHVLNMFGTMGNATTFPVETLVFYCLAVASFIPNNRLSVFPEWESFDRISVFGDDCIVPTCVTRTFIEVCDRLGFLVNNNKTFKYEDDFRESCGGDFFAGYDVRPFYLRAPHNCNRSSYLPWLYVVFNRLFEKYIQYFGPLTYMYNKELFKLMNDLLSDPRYVDEVFIVPRHYPDDSGLKIFEDFSRWSQNVFTKVHFAEVYRNRHGTLHFKFSRFVYKETYYKGDDRVRLWDKLKFPGRCDIVTVKMRRDARKRHEMLPFTDPRVWYTHKRIGGYVVGKSLDGCLEIS